jgi:hypothetical protein
MCYADEKRYSLAEDGTTMLDEEWIKTLEDGRIVKFTNQELPDEVTFITAQIESNKVVYSIILAKAKIPLRREEVESHFEGELSKVAVGFTPTPRWKPESQVSSGTVGTIKRLTLCEEQNRLLDAYVTATDRQAEAVKSLSKVAGKDNRAAFGEALAHAEQTRQDVEEARLALQLHSKTHRC